MIGYLKGIIQEKSAESLLVNVRGVGYRVTVSISFWEKIQPKETCSFFVYTHVRENEISLYGFPTLADQKIFTSLLSVSGIGPKIALGILSAAKSTDQIIGAIQDADVQFFSDIKGLGKKSAQRLIVDLKPKIGGLGELQFNQEQDQDLVSALKGLGFTKEEIQKSTQKIKKALPLAEKIKLALKDNL